MSYNKNFELGLRDLELIEKSLEQKINHLNEQRLAYDGITSESIKDSKRVQDIDQNIKKIKELLKKLDNQKCNNSQE